MKYFEIDAFFPHCDEDGSLQTCILLSNGTKQYSHYSIKNFIPHLLCDVGLDARSVHLWSSRVTGLKHNIPLIVDNLNVFLPVKFATSIDPHTTLSSFGYVNSGSIASYSDHEIILKTEVILPTLSSAKFIEKKMVDAKLLTYAYLDTKKQFEFMWKNEFRR